MKKGYSISFWFFWGGLLSGAAFLAFSLLIHSNLVNDTDHHQLLAVYSQRTPECTSVFIFIQQLGSKNTLFPILAAGGLYLILFKRLYDVVFLFSSVWGAYVINDLLKNYFHRPRPSFGMLLQENSFGYPSRHTMLAVAFYGGIGMLIWMNKKMSDFLLMKLAVLTAAIILLIGFSMVYLGAHFPSDIMGGLLASTSWLFFCGAWYQKARK
ncbi:phosphatase PAP2 family protein [Fictibacillus enclensis]|uniref:phosphatase PAP2 family protein n=1 Tax=Fictibacillus enclensis TaxID=1017270 RepID=UPI0025A16478|nr:phosphatase PAP2 family protein [Fictibacillus enclensis]MDM5197493.1 phosphatase PAP2 family protein [Fictibacillus enclensis]